MSDKAAYMIGTVCLYSTGHFIGGFILLIGLVAVILYEKR